jgi:hypothetical protein
MCRHQTDFLDWQAQRLGGHPVRFRSGLEPPDGIGRERMFEQIAQTGVVNWASPTSDVEFVRVASRSLAPRSRSIASLTSGCGGN